MGEGADGDTDGSSDEPFRISPELTAWTRANSVVLAAGALGVVVSLQLLGVAKGRVPTALAVLQAGGTGTVATAALATVLPMLLFAATVLAAIARVVLRRTAHRRALTLAVVVGVFVSLAVVPAGVVVFGLVVGGASAFWARRRPPEEDTPWATIVVLAVAGVIAWAAAAPPWWPVEEIEVRTGRNRVAYVVGADAQDVVLLDHHEADRTTPPG